MKSFIRNSITSVFTTALDFGVLTGLVELFHVNYVLATFLGTVVGAASNFIINRHWSFEVGHITPQWQMARFLPVQVGSSALQTGGVWLATDHLGVQYMLSKLLVAVAVYLAWNYPMNRFFVFRQWHR
ncbi:MAG TPA: GtrA family protein [Kofleriaceae bacterium]|nr:GtrA family protein [Kofleriaceae bacterium]